MQPAEAASQAGISDPDFNRGSNEGVAISVEPENLLSNTATVFPG
jgi:hypothetical protein